MCALRDRLTDREKPPHSKRGEKPSWWRRYKRAVDPPRRDLSFRILSPRVPRPRSIKYWCDDAVDLNSRKRLGSFGSFPSAATLTLRSAIRDRATSPSCYCRLRATSTAPRFFFWGGGVPAAALSRIPWRCSALLWPRLPLARSCTDGNLHHQQQLVLWRRHEFVSSPARLLLCALYPSNGETWAAPHAKQIVLIDKAMLGSRHHRLTTKHQQLLR